MEKNNFSFLILDTLALLWYSCVTENKKSTGRNQVDTTKNRLPEWQPDRRLLICSNSDSSIHQGAGRTSLLLVLVAISPPIFEEICCKITEKSEGRKPTA